MSEYLLWETIRINTNEAIIDNVSLIRQYTNDILHGNKELKFPENFHLYLTEKGSMPDNLLITGFNALLFSERLINLLLDNGVDSFDFYPCAIKEYTLENNVYPYYLVVIREFIYCLDKDNSDLYFVYDDPGGEIDSVMSVCVNETILDKENNVFFRLAEDRFNVIVHKSIKNVVENEGMTGMIFTPADGTHPIIKMGRQEEGWLYQRKEKDYAYMLENEMSYCLNKNFPVRKYAYEPLDDEE